MSTLQYDIPVGGIAGGARGGGSGTTYGSATTSERDSRQHNQRVDVHEGKTSVALQKAWDVTAPGGEDTPRQDLHRTQPCTRDAVVIPQGRLPPSLSLCC